MSASDIHYTIFSLAPMTPIIAACRGQVERLVISRIMGLPRSIAVSERKTRMIAYTAWDSLQAFAQQYDANLVIAPGERIGLRMRPNHFVPRASKRGLGERLRAGIALLQVQVPSERRVGENPIA